MKYERELNKVFEEALREPWMDNDDWEFIKIAIVNHPKFDLEKMEKDIDTGIEIVSKSCRLEIIKLEKK